MAAAGLDPAARAGVRLVNLPESADLNQAESAK
jgi:hypothetical protein